MYKPWIAAYAERTNPETAYRNNTESTRKIIEDDAVKQLTEDKELVEVLAEMDTPIREEVRQEFFALAKWLAAFRSTRAADERAKTEATP